MLAQNGYQPASYCFSAVLQLSQGAFTPEAVRLRRRCGLLLAQFDLDHGKVENCIARCTEVINECIDITPSFDESKAYTLREENDMQDLNEQEITFHDLGRAHFMRAKSLLLLGKPSMAKQDFQSALHYLPDEVQIHNEMSKIEVATIVQAQESPDYSSSDDGHMMDFVDECTLKHPSLVFSKKQLHRLMVSSLHRSNISASNENLRVPSSSASPLDVSSLFGSFGSNDVIGDAVGGSRNGLLDKAISFVPMLCSLTGVSVEASRSIVRILSALSSGYATSRRAYDALRSHSDTLMMLLGALWAAGLLRSYWRL